MDYTMIIRPMIGAVIGYVTNWIAVKMMFRPLKPIKIGNWRLPFTPGIIPKNKKRIADSIGNAISENLLTEEVLQKNLLSEENEIIIRSKVEDILNHLKKCDKSLEEELNDVMKRDSYDIAIAYIIDSLSDSIYKTVKKANIGEIVAREIENTAMEKINSSFIGMLGGNAIVLKFSSSAREKVNEYIEKNGYSLISNMIEQEILKTTNTKISELIISAEKTEIDFADIVMKLYQKIVLEKLSDILKVINISKIVTDKIDSMDMQELEKLILQIMNKELNALVNLGAIIGFVLGLLNLFV